MKKITSVICLFLISFSGYCQIYFNTIPEEKQLIGRDISTNKGLMTDQEAKELGLGGELICTVF